MTDKITRFLAEHRPATPCLVIDLEAVADQYRVLRHHLPLASVFYAVKANPAPEIVALLHDLGASFDVASAAEIDLCLSLGIKPDRLSYGSTIKKAADIARVHAQGVDLFAFDCLPELEKIADAAPGARVFCRLLVDNDGALWPLGRKFGCSPAEAEALMHRAEELGLRPFGLSFHLGSQQTDLAQWDRAVGTAAAVFRNLADAGLDLAMLNLGGGFPATYRETTPAAEAFADAISKAMTRHFGNHLPDMVIEPGRFLVADAGILETEIVLIADKGADQPVRWVYLDVGRFGGLAETEGEAIRYRIATPRDGAETRPAVLAGPTCDSADILYERSDYALPIDLEIGDRVRLLSTGAYTSVYASQGFNGFPPPALHVI